MRGMLRLVLAGVVVLVITAYCSTMSSADDREDWEKELDAALSERLSVEFDGTELSKALDYFRQRLKVNIILQRDPDEEVMPRVILRLANVQGESALAWTVRLAGYSYVVRDQAILVLPSASVDADTRRQIQERYERRSIDQEHGWVQEVEKKLAAEVSMQFFNDTVDRAADQLSAKSGLNIVVDTESVEKAGKVDFKADKMSVENFVRWIAKLSGLRYTVRDEVVFIASQANMNKLQLETGTSAVATKFRKPVSYDFKDTPLLSALKQLQQKSNIEIEVPNPPKGTYEVTLKGDKVELNRAVTLVVAQSGLIYAITYRENSIVVVLQERKTAPAAEPDKP